VFGLRSTGDKQAAVKLCRVEIEEIAVALSPPAGCRRVTTADRGQVRDDGVLDRPARGGNYRHVFVTEDGTECSFRGTYLEVEPPVRTVETWLFGGWPDAEAVETWQLHETDGVTTLTMRLAFRDKAGRDHYPARGEDAGELNSSDGPGASLDAMEEIVRSLLDSNGTVSE
jgi:Activator of Hsp90 ATPase homolog 1-like protein